MVRKVIAFEGLPCVGKTSIIYNLQKRLKCSVIEEWSTFIDDMPFSIEKRCEINDEYKRYKIEVGSGLMLVDRYYISTLACRFSETSLSYNEFIGTVDLSNYDEPDCWVYIYESVSSSILRSKKYRMVNESSPWFSVDKLHRIFEFYTCWFNGKQNALCFRSSEFISMANRAANI